MIALLPNILLPSHNHRSDFRWIIAFFIHRMAGCTLLLAVKNKIGVYNLGVIPGYRSYSELQIRGCI